MRHMVVCDLSGVSEPLFSVWDKWGPYYSESNESGIREGGGLGASGRVNGCWELAGEETGGEDIGGVDPDIFKVGGG
jgi:hypothetical protein